MSVERGYQITVGQEELLSLKDSLARFISGAVGGRHIHNSTAYRWALKGVRGLRLPTVRIGGRLFTSRGAFSWWAGRLAEAMTCADHGEEMSGTTSEAAIELLRQVGIRRSTPGHDGR